MRLIAAVLLLLPLLASAAVPDSIGITLVRNPDGTYNPQYRTGNKPPDAPTLDCTNSGTAELTGLLNGAGTYSENVRDDFSGTGAAACTLAVATESGDSAAGNGWSISGDNLTNPRTTNGSGALRVTCTTAGDTRQCPVRAWSVIDPPSTDNVAPTVPLGLEAVPGTNQVTFSWDASHDPAPDASGVSNYDFLINGSVSATVSGVAGISPEFSEAQIGGADGTPDSTQSGASVDLSFGGTGFDALADGLLVYGALVSGDQVVSGTVGACASAADFEKCGVIIRDGANQDSAYIAVYYQGNGRVQAKARTAAGVTPSTVATQTVALPLSVKIGRSGSTFTAQYSSDGGPWQTLGTTSVATQSTVTAGAFITSGSAGVNATGTIENLTVSTAARLSRVHNTTSAVTATVRARDNDGNVSAVSAGVVGTPNVSAAPQLRWAPGHYVRFGNGDTLASQLAFIDAEYDTTNVRGFLAARWWAEMESTKGSYNVGPSSTIGQIFARAKLRGSKMILRVQDKKFGSTSVSGVLPSYMTTEGCTYSRTTPTQAAGAALWREHCMTNYINMFKALLDEYGDEPTLVAISMEESVYGQNLPADYSASALTSQFIRAMQELRAYEPRVGFIVKTNWINGDDAAKTQMLRYFAAARADRGVYVNGGPDALVNAGGSSNTSDGWNAQIGAIGGVDHRGQYPIWGNTDIDDFNRGAGPSQVHAKLVTTGDANIMTWLKVGANGVTWSTMRTWIEANPIPAGQFTCPAQVTQGCDTQ